MNNKIIISGGGSGGHIFPAIAIANALKAKQPDIDILFVGAQDKLEMEKVPKAGYPIEGLWISGFHRKWTWRNLLFPFKLIASLWKSTRILRRFRPDVVVGVGGFASGPMLEMASRLGSKSLIQEQNSFPGITNRLLGKKVDRICVAYEQMERFFPADKLLLTGNPVRQDIALPPKRLAEAFQYFGLDSQKPVILLFGGSLGARSMNEAVAASTEVLKANPEIQLLWQCGKLYTQRYVKSQSAALPNVKLVAFIDRMDLAYLMADVIICRAGAMTIAELCILGKAAVLVPSPNVAEDHQAHNARALVNQKAAVMIKDSEAASQMIPQAIKLQADGELRSQLSRNISRLAKPQAAKLIAEEVLKLAVMG